MQRKTKVRGHERVEEMSKKAQKQQDGKRDQKRVTKTAIWTKRAEEAQNRLKQI